MVMKKKIAGAVVGALCVAGIGIAFLLPDAAPREEMAKTEERTKPSAHVHRPRPAKSAQPIGARERPPKPQLDIDVEEDDDMTPAERALATRIEKALEDEKFEDAAACAKEALACGNAEVRQAMVDTLGWFGRRALPELTPFLVDADEDVRDSAMNEWSMAVSEIENDEEKLGIVELAMNVLSNEDALEEISGEYIGVDEKVAIESLVRVIEAGGSASGIAKAKETYEFVTGDEWKDRAAAEKWIAEEYEPPAP